MVKPACSKGLAMRRMSCKDEEWLLKITGVRKNEYDSNKCILMKIMTEETRVIT